MTRKDYELLSEVICIAVFANKGKDRETRILRILAESMAHELGKNNKAFDRELFLKNCGVMSE